MAQTKKMRPRKDERSYWGYEQQWNGQLKSVQNFHDLPLNSQQPQNAILGYSFHGAPENILLPRNLKMAPFKPRAIRHSLPHWGTVQRVQTGATATNDIWATCFFPCDKNIFRPHHFPLASKNTDVAPVNHLALVKTSDQPSFSSNFSPFTSADALRASDT